MNPAYLEVVIFAVLGLMCLILGFGMRHKNAVAPVPEKSNPKSLIAIVIGAICLVAATVLGARRFID